MELGEELVVLVDEEGRPIGHAPKRTVHTTHTPLHLAFSCHVRDGAGRILVTRRALGKRTWPGVWTNSFCGHPAPGEDVTQAVVRRGRQELGIDLEDLELALPDFRYRAVDASGIVEHELCPVYVARVRGDVSPDPDEVVEWKWVDEAALTAAVESAGWAFSPWLALQLTELAARQR